MADKYKIKCSECDKQDTFLDDKDITYHKWKIIAYDVGKCEPIVICPNCEYTSVVKTSKKKK